MPELVQPNDLYADRYTTFLEALKRACLVSYGSSGLLVSSSRQFYCTLLFTKLVLLGKSVCRLAPTEDEFNNEHVVFDACGMASVTRSQIDAFQMFFHLGVDECCEVEHEARRLIAYWKDNSVRSRFFSAFEDDQTNEADSFHRDNLTQRLSKNAYFAGLPEKQQRHLLKKGQLIDSPSEILEKSGCNAQQMLAWYTYLSGYAHCDSIAFMRSEAEGRGTGSKNDADVGIYAICLELAGLILSSSSDFVEKVIPGSMERASSVIVPDPLSGQFPLRPWQGQKVPD